jgi:hypothetical protein
MFLILNNVQDRGYIKRLGNKGAFPDLVNLYFAHDNLFFLEVNSSCIEILKWILIAFKDLFGFKINFKKYEIFSLNIYETEGEHLADILGYKLSSLPIIYLGFPLYLKKIQ